MVSVGRTLELHITQENFEDYGIDWDGPAVIEEENINVEVPSTATPLQLHKLEILRLLVNPLEESDDMGVTLYAITKQIVKLICQNC